MAGFGFPRFILGLGLAIAHFPLSFRIYGVRDILAPPGERLYYHCDY